MKKFLFVVAAALMANATFAAAALWQASGGNFFNGTGSTEASAKYTGALYIFDTAVLAQEALYNAWCSDSGYVASHAVGTLSVSAGSIVSTDNANRFNYGTPGQTGYSFYSVLVDSDKIYFSNIKDGLTATESTLMPNTIGFSTQNDGTTTFSALAPVGDSFNGAGHWSAVPEPGTMSLLLVGLAGVGLKRKFKKAKKA